MILQRNYHNCWVKAHWIRTVFGVGKSYLFSVCCQAWLEAFKYYRKWGGRDDIKGVRRTAGAWKTNMTGPIFKRSELKMMVTEVKESLYRCDVWSADRLGKNRSSGPKQGIGTSYLIWLWSNRQQRALCFCIFST